MDLLRLVKDYIYQETDYRVEWPALTTDFQAEGYLIVFCGNNEIAIISSSTIDIVQTSETVLWVSIPGERDIELIDFHSPSSFDTLTQLLDESAERYDGYSGRAGKTPVAEIQ
jgi:hypothetical protein